MRRLYITAALLVTLGIGLEVRWYVASHTYRHEIPLHRTPARGVLVQVHGGSVQDGIAIAKSYPVMLRAANRLHIGERVLAGRIRITEWSPHLMLISGPRQDALAVAACYRDAAS